MTFQEAPTGRQAVSAANPNNTNDKLSKLKVFKRGRSRELSKWYLGILTTNLAQPEDTNGAFFLVEATLAPGTEPPPHVHSREDELFYVLEGEFDMYVGEEAFKVTTGECIFLPRLKPHGFIIGSPRIRVLTLFVPGGVEGSFRGMGSPAQHLDLPAVALTYSEADFKQTVQRFAEYGVRILTPDEVAVELPLYPKRFLRSPIESVRRKVADINRWEAKWRRMRIPKRDVAILVAFAIGGMNQDFAQDTTERLRPLVETSARRLALAREVALAKWDTRSPVEDPAREAEVINAAVKDAVSRGLNPTWASRFFRAQIEANKIVQYYLLAQWYRAGTAPAHRPINLDVVIRPELDQVEKKLVEVLVDTAPIRAGAACQAATAKAVGKYLAAHKHDIDPLLAIALDRAMAATCYDSK